MLYGKTLPGQIPFLHFDSLKRQKIQGTSSFEFHCTQMLPEITFSFSDEVKQSITWANENPSASLPIFSLMIRKNRAFVAYRSFFEFFPLAIGSKLFLPPLAEPSSTIPNTSIIICMKNAALLHATFTLLKYSSTVIKAGNTYPDITNKTSIPFSKIASHQLYSQVNHSHVKVPLYHLGTETYLVAITGTPLLW